jgi:predicted Ser/Thr protein kinase
LYEPVTDNYQYCTTLCLASLIEGSYDSTCPNAEHHKQSFFNVDAVVNDVLEFIREDEGEVIGGGNSANCLAVRSELFGHVLVAKAFYARTDVEMFENEVKIYEHLTKLQGIHVPFVLGKSISIAGGEMRPIIIMSYGGVPLDRCTSNNELVDSLAEALRELGRSDVYYEDFSLHNILAHENQVSVIDFESARIIPHDPESISVYEETIRILAERTKESGDLRDFIP